MFWDINEVIMRRKMMWHSLVWSTLHNPEETQALIKNTCFNIEHSEDIFLMCPNRRTQREMCVFINVCLGVVFFFHDSNKERYVSWKKWGIIRKGTNWVDKLRKIGDRKQTRKSSGVLCLTDRTFRFFFHSHLTIWCSVGLFSVESVLLYL